MLEAKQIATRDSFRVGQLGETSADHAREAGPDAESRALRFNLPYVIAVASFSWLDRSA